MKVLYVTQYFSSEPTHASTVTTLEIVKRLAQRGHKVSVVSADSPGIARIYAKEAERCRVISAFPVPKFSAQWYDGFTTFLTHTVVHILLFFNVLVVNQFHEKFDVIISMYHPSHMAPVSAYLLSRILKLPLVAKIHDFIVEATEPHMVKRMYNVVLGSINLGVLRKSDAILVQSPELLEVAKHQGGIDGEKMIIFPNGVDTKFFKPRIKSDLLRKKLALESRILALFLGSLYRCRHAELLIKALPGIVREIEHFTILFVGEGPEKSKLLSLARHLGVSDFVKFIGSVRHSIVPEVISMADVTVGPLTVTSYPTIYGATPLTVLEYMACEKPVIVCRGAVSESLVIDSYSGVVLEPNDIGGLSAAVVNLIEDQEFSKSIGRNARRYVEKICSWDVLITRLEKVLNSVVYSAD